MKLRTLARAILGSSASLVAFAAAPALAQNAPVLAAAPASDDQPGTAIIVTGSRIKQDPSKSALPLQIITTTDLSREGISNPEQLISFLASNGNGAAQ